MPGESAIVEAPAAPAAAPVAAPEAPKGIQAAMADFKETTTPKPAPAKPEAAKPVAEPKPAAPAKPAPVKPTDIWEKADPKLKNEYFKTKREAEESKASYEKQIKAFEARPKSEPAVDTKAVEQYQKQLKEYQEKLSAADYRQSPDWKKFEDSYAEEKAAAIAEVKRMTVRYKDADGMDKERPATEEDFLEIAALPPGKQDRIINEVFGPSGGRIFARLLEMQRIDRAASKAMAEHVKTAEVKAVESKAAAEKSEQEYGKYMEDSQAELAKEWPEHFAPDDNDPDGSAALKKGYDFVDTATQNGANMTPQDRAAHIAVIRARAAAFPATVLKMNRVVEEVKSLKAELAKYRKSDPGSETETPGDTPARGDEVPKGIEAATKEFAGLKVG